MKKLKTFEGLEVMKAFCIIYLSCFIGLQSQDKEAKKWKITADFNNDGLIDYALSDLVETFGNSGGHFDLYLKTKNKTYIKVGPLFFHHKAIEIEHLKGMSRIWFYWRKSSNSGSLGYYEIEGNKLSKPTSFNISPGDAGTELGTALYEAVFKKSKSQITKELID